MTARPEAAPDARPRRGSSSGWRPSDRSRKRREATAALPADEAAARFEFDAERALLAGRVVAILILLVGLTLTAAAWGVTAALVEERMEERFDNEVVQVRRSIIERFHAYEQVLKGGQGLLEASEDVTRDDWRMYVESLELSEHYPGIQGMGWAVVVDAEDRAAHEAAVRNESAPGVDASVFRNYRIHGAPGADPERDPLTTIVYLEPFDARNRQAFGFDMLSEPIRREAMMRAGATGEAAMSGRVVLVQEITADVQPGFLVYLPVYGEPGQTNASREPTERLKGWVYAPFRAHDLMRGILGDSDLDVTFEIFDGESAAREALLYDHDRRFHRDVDEERRPDLERLETIEIAGRHWTIHYASTKTLEATYDRTVPYLVAGIGFVSSVLLFGIAFVLGTSRARAYNYAADMTRHLRQSEQDKTRLAGQLARSNEDLQQFAYVASHDLQEPLRMVSSYLQLLERRYGDRLDERAKEYIHFASEGASRMRTLIEALLDFSRVNQRALPSAAVDMEEVVREALHALALPLDETRSVVQVGALPPAAVDRPQIVRVFQNLISNAIKYRGDAPARISVRGEPDPKDENMVLYCVQDEGIGIDPRYHDQIFVMFKRLHSRDDYPGSGMGLAICQRIVQRHGGTIWVESAAGEGSTFRFTLPKPPAVASDGEGATGEQGPAPESRP